MSLHPDARRFLALTSGALPLDTQTVEQNRQNIRNAIPLTGDREPMSVVRDIGIAGVPCRVYTARDQAHPSSAVVYFHGGGWVTGDLDIADTTARAIAYWSDATVISVDYRQPPEAPFPAALDDALAVVTAMLTGGSGLGIDPTRVAVAGDSAGGNLAAVAAQELRGHSPALAHQALIYPVMDLYSRDTESHRAFATDYNLTARNLDYFYDLYAGDHDRKDVRLSPGRNRDLTGLASATVLTAEYDPLRDEGEAYAHALAEAGISVTSVRFNGHVHPFVYMSGVVGAADAARRFIGTELRSALSARP